MRVNLAAPIPDFLVGDVQAKLAYLDTRVSAASVNAAGDTITMELASEIDQDGMAELEAIVRELVATMTEDAFEPEMKILERREGSMPYSDDPMITMLANRDVVKEGVGYYAVGPLLTGVITFIDRAVQDIARAMGADRYRFPSLIAPEYMEKVQYFTNFPHSLSFVSHLEENIKGIARFSEEATTCKGHVEADPSLYDKPSAILTPTVCHHLYCMLEDCKLTDAGLAATAMGNCFRFESRNMLSLERVWNFTMREIIFVGEDDFVSDNLTEVRKRFRAVLEDLDLNFAVETANDPFFVGTFRDQAAYQAAFELKYEIRADLPYRGKTLAIGSYNRHGNFFGRKLNIQNSDGSPASTGCFGVGFERIALAFVAQHGPDPDKWPSIIQDAVSEATSAPVRFSLPE